MVVWYGSSCVCFVDVVLVVQYLFLYCCFCIVDGVVVVGGASYALPCLDSCLTVPAAVTGHQNYWAKFRVQ